MLQSIMGYGYPPVDRQMKGQTHVKTLPSHHTTYVGSNESPPAWPQKAYCLRPILSVACAIRGGGGTLSWSFPGERGTPVLIISRGREGWRGRGGGTHARPDWGTLLPLDRTRTGVLPLPQERAWDQRPGYPSFPPPLNLWEHNLPSYYIRRR